jgi:hypothetical protein
MTMPPAPKPIQASEFAEAAIERNPPMSSAISLSATIVTHGAPNDTARISSVIVATIQEARVSTDCSFSCSCIINQGFCD